MSAEFDWVEWSREIASRTSSERSPGAEATRANAAWVTEQEELHRRLLEPERRHWLVFLKAVRLAKDVETLEALLDGESVSVDRLDAGWMARYGRRR
jgi:hypothetical protein